MSQEFQAQSQAPAPAPTSGRTGTVCPATGSYRANTTRTEFIIMLQKGDVFPAYPGGDATTVTWYSTKGTTSTSTSFEGVKAEAGAA